MTMHPIDGIARPDAVPRMPRFVLVNERTPREDACCTVCCTRIDRGYVRDPRTRLLYCDAQCFTEHEKISLPVVTQQARRVS